MTQWLYKLYKRLYKKRLRIERGKLLTFIYFENSPIDNIKYFIDLILNNKIIATIGTLFTIYALISLIISFI